MEDKTHVKSAPVWILTGVNPTPTTNDGDLRVTTPPIQPPGPMFEPAEFQPQHHTVASASTTQV
jgi:hypothetical protein